MITPSKNAIVQCQTSIRCSSKHVRYMGTAFIAYLFCCSIKSNSRCENPSPSTTKRQAEVMNNAEQGAGVCGYIFLVCGVGSVISGFILVGNNDTGADGLWSGVGLLIAGFLGVMTRRRHYKGAMTGFLVVTIILVIAEFVQSIIAGVRYSYYKYRENWTCSRTSGTCKCLETSFSLYWSTENDLFCNATQLSANIGSLLAIIIFSILGGIVSFIGSIFGCMGICKGRQRDGTIIYQPPAAVSTVTTHHAPLPVYQASQPGHFVPPTGNYSAPQPFLYLDPTPQQGPQPNSLVQQPVSYSAPTPVQQFEPAPQQTTSSVRQPASYSVPEPVQHFEPAPQSGPQQTTSSLQQPASYSTPEPVQHLEPAPQSGLQSTSTAPQTASCSAQRPVQPSDEPPTEYVKHPL